VVDQLRQRAPEVAAVDDPVDDAVLEEEFASLEAAGELDADGVGDGLRAGKADEVARTACSGPPAKVILSMAQ
jgi:hypothetical protein